MYNRYVPRSDGSYARNRVEDRSNQPQNRSKPAHPPQDRPNPPPPCQEKQSFTPPYRENEHSKASNPLGFIRQLIGKDFDTGDLIVILLLLLMAGDSPEERNNAILTIALYFLM